MTNTDAAANRGTQAAQQQQQLDLKQFQTDQERKRAQAAYDAEQRRLAALNKK